MAETGEHILGENCNLIIRGTHTTDRVDNYNTVFVTDNDNFEFSADNAWTQAQDQANDSLNAEDGCKTCPISSDCNPIATVISKATEHILVPAIQTSFK